MARSRREFLRDAAIATTLVPIACGKSARPALELPVVIATWDFGLELCKVAQQVLAAGGDLLDALERGVNVVEDDPTVLSVGYNAWPNADGVVQLDASIMDGRGHRAGAVAALERIKNPISVARKVMERTRHVLLAGAGALAFARQHGFDEQELLSPDARRLWETLPRESFWRDTHDTVGCIGLDAAGNLASAVSTSGLAGKLAGRVGDAPLIGAGNYVDNDVGGACATGIGELAIKNAAAFAIVERMRAGVSPATACMEILERIARKHPEVKSDPQMLLAFIAMNKLGEVGAGALRNPLHTIRYALARGTETAPTMHGIEPLLA